MCAACCFACEDSAFLRYFAVERASVAIILVFLLIGERK